MNLSTLGVHFDVLFSKHDRAKHISRIETMAQDWVVGHVGLIGRQHHGKYARSEEEGEGARR